MTTQQRISRLASVALDATPLVGTSPKKATAPGAAKPSALAQSPWTANGPRKDASSRAASRSRFVPLQCEDQPHLRVLFTGWKARGNRKRRHGRPPVALALFGLLVSTGAVIADLPEGRAEIYSRVPELRESLGAVTSLIFSEPAHESELTAASGDMVSGR